MMTYIKFRPFVLSRSAIVSTVYFSIFSSSFLSFEILNYKITIVTRNIREKKI